MPFPRDPDFSVALQRNAPAIIVIAAANVGSDLPAVAEARVQRSACRVAHQRVFSACLAGMAVGCLFVAPQADRFGRRNMILIALTLVAGAMTLPGFVKNVPQLMAARFLVGVGVGTIGVSMTAMAAEYAPPRFANFAVGFVQAGWPLGSILTAFAVIKVMPGLGWQTVLIGIGAVTVLLLVLVFVCLPESMSFLSQRQPNNALRKLNVLRAPLLLKALDALPPNELAGARISVAALFQSGRKTSSILLWVAVAIGYFVLYFVSRGFPSWPRRPGCRWNKPFMPVHLITPELLSERRPSAGSRCAFGSTL